ncbi:MAG: hypothetical protein LBL47_04745, partial [Lactobacillus sp.]|nr:hypothetical protein [Lactobacillus sp.]
DTIAEHVEGMKEPLRNIFDKKEEDYKQFYKIIDHSTFYIEIVCPDCSKYHTSLRLLKGESFALLTKKLIENMYIGSSFKETIHCDTDDSYCVDIYGDFNLPQTDVKVHLIIQCKTRRKTNAGIKLNELKEFVGGSKAYIYSKKEKLILSEMHPITMIYITNSFFNDDCINYMKKIGITYIDAEKYIKLIIRNSLLNTFIKLTKHNKKGTLK